MRPVDELLPSSSYLEHAFLRWVLRAAAKPSIVEYTRAQDEVAVAGHNYRTDYTFGGATLTIDIELDGFAFHGHRRAFTYDRLRQNDLQSLGRRILRFDYNSIRDDTARCVAQLQEVLKLDPVLKGHLIEPPIVERPQMETNLLAPLMPSPHALHRGGSCMTYFEESRSKIALATLRPCQQEAFWAVGDYFARGGRNAACVMSVGAGKTALGVVVCLGLGHRRALIVTPGNVIRGTFSRALDPNDAKNVLYGLPSGPMLPGCPPPKVRVLDRDEGPVRDVTREALLDVDIIVSNFHSVGTGADPDDLIAKLKPEDIDLIIVDEAHIAAAESYQRLFAHFKGARTLLMSACFQRLDGKPIEADVVYRYRLIDSIVDGHAKNLRIVRFAPDPTQVIYEVRHPDGLVEEIHGRDAVLELIDEARLSRIVARSTEPIRQMMRTVRRLLDEQRQLLHPVRPRILFSALGEKHAEQITALANEHGIATDYVHYSMPESRIKGVLRRFESDAGDLDAVVQLKMLGQGYDLPAITIVGAFRPYGSFGEFYQFVGRGLRAIQHPALAGRVPASRQRLDMCFHADLGLDMHVETLYAENDMDPRGAHPLPDGWQEPLDGGREPTNEAPATDRVGRPEMFVVFEPGSIVERVVYDEKRVETQAIERRRQALMQRYQHYAQTTPQPMAFDEFVKVAEVLFRE